MRAALILILTCLTFDLPAKELRDEILRPPLDGPRAIGCYYSDELYEDPPVPWELWKSTTRYLVRTTTAMPLPKRTELNQFVRGPRTSWVACLRGFYEPWHDEMFIVMDAVLKLETDVTAAEIDDNRWVCRQNPFLLIRPRMCKTFAP